MGNCCPTLRFYRRTSPVNPKNVTLLLVGLDNAGKTTIAKRLSEEPLDGVVPTVGFSKVSLEEKGCLVTIYDLGGGPQIRDIWPRYYPDVHGVIFVVDSSDIPRMNECRKALEGLLLDSYISGKPVLLLANKQDVEGALDEIDIVDRLNIEPLVNQQKCPTLVELCSARHFSRKMDIGIDNGYKWLLRCISKDYPSLNNRVLKDLATQEELERIKRVQREERIKKARQERELDEIQEESRLTSDEPVQPSGENSYRNGIIRMADVAGIPGQIEEEPRACKVHGNVLRDGAPRKPQFSVSYSCEFLKYERDSSDMLLIRNMDESSQSARNFLVRPKSSGPRLNNSKSEVARRRAPRRKSYQRNNKTAPSPVLDLGMEPFAPLPKVFDPNYRGDGNGQKDSCRSAGEGTTLKTVVEVEPWRAASAREVISGKENQPTSKSMPTSRKTSGRCSAKRKSASNDQVCSLMSAAGRLPPLRVGRPSPGRELILDVTKLDD